MAVHTPVDVDDNDACTIDACVNGVAVHTPVDVDDNDACTIDACVNGVAVHTPVDVDDNDACTMDACVNGVAVHTPVDVDDNDACTIDACVNGVAVHTPINVDDNDACTIDACVNGVAVHTFQDTDNDGVCDATDICPGFDDNVDTDSDGIPDGCDDICSAPIISEFTATAPLCQGGSAQLEATVTGTAPFYFTWSGPGFNQSGTTNSLTVEGASTGTYQVIVTNACGDDTATVNMLVTPFPIATWNPPAIPCSGNGTMNLDSLVTGTTGGTWSGAGVIGASFDPSSIQGTTVITYTVGTGVCSATEAHSIVVNQSPIAFAGDDDEVCALSYALQAVISTVPGTWSAPVVGVFTDASSASSTVTVIDNGSYPFVWTVGDGQCFSSDTVIISFHDPGTPLWVDAGEDQDIDVFTSTQLDGAAASGLNVLWSVVSGNGIFSNANDTSTQVVDLAVGENVFVLSATFGQGCAQSTDTVLITVNDIFIPQGFSPNGDGVNDSFRITGINAFPGNDLKVFNRWGQEVVGQSGYANDWKGSGSNGQDLPDDTYFYVLNLTPERTYNGFVVIKR
ncbi:MAG: gliding motility-associated C-terminal domain-containing protein [Flavobacteriales bacterium]|nr:gliding motility-associated C-terminal domain-containing protein [Flavobacteriales bacterium]